MNVCYRIRHTVVGLSLLGLSACGLLPDQIDMTEGWSAQRFYSTAKGNVADGNYQTAARYFEQLQARYPFGRYAQQAQLDLIYVYYKDDQPDQAIAAADRFIRTYPRNPFVDYAHYMRGLVNFDRGAIGIANQLMPSDPEKTDTATITEAFDDYAELVRRFPDSRYAEDARQRMIYLRNNLAAYELHVADYYLRRKAYVAAANRAKHVLENFASTPVVDEALVIQTRAYLELGLRDLAEDSLRVLSLNYPDSPYVPALTTQMEGGEYRDPGDGFSFAAMLDEFGM